MSEYLKEQAGKGQQLYDELTNEKRNKLALIAARIVEMQRGITGEIKANGVDVICTECVDDCCQKKHEERVFEAEYFTFVNFVASDEIREMIYESTGLVNLSPNCTFSHYGDGCVIPENIRPVSCKAWFCPANKEMDRIRDELGSVLQVLFEDFKRVLHE